MITTTKVKHNSVVPKGCDVILLLEQMLIYTFKEFAKICHRRRKKPKKKLQDFYFIALLPELACPRHHSMGIPEPLK